MNQFYGGPLDGLKLDAELEIGFHRYSDRGGYYYDGERFSHAYLARIEHVTQSGHTWIFLYTCRRRMLRAAGYLTQRCGELFSWHDAAKVTQRLREMELR